MAWTAEQIPDLTGKIILITGANSGIGFEAAKLLAAHGASIVLACRNKEKAQAAEAEVKQVAKGGQTDILLLDLSSLESIREAAAHFQSTYNHLDILINNAGLAWRPREITVDGFESQFGTNYLGHFLLTGLLFPALKKAPGGRVVSVSSVAHRFGKIHFDDIHLERNYSIMGSYGQSKVADLLFSYELDRRLRRAGLKHMAALAAHPGNANTNIAAAGFRERGNQFLAGAAGMLTGLVTHSAYAGCLPMVRAAVDRLAQGGEYYGPAHMFESFGPPVKVDSSAYSKSEDNATRLWALSEELLNFSFKVA